MPVARSLKRGYLSSVPPALHSVLHAAFVRCCGLYGYTWVYVCIHVTVTSTSQAVCICIVYNRTSFEGRFCVFATAGKSSSSLLTGIYGHSLKVYVRQKANETRLSASTVVRRLYTYRDKCSFDSRVAAFAVPSGNFSSLVVEWRAERRARGRIPLPLPRLKCFRVQGTK